MDLLSRWMFKLSEWASFSTYDVGRANTGHILVSSSCLWTCLCLKRGFFETLFSFGSESIVVPHRVTFQMMVESGIWQENKKACWGVDWHENRAFYACHLSIQSGFGTDRCWCVFLSYLLHSLFISLLYTELRTRYWNRIWLNYCSLWSMLMWKRDVQA